MKNFNEHTLILEYVDSPTMLRSDITSYIKKVAQQVPQATKSALVIISKYPKVLTRRGLEEIEGSLSTDTAALASKYNITEQDVNDLRTSLKTLKQNSQLKTLPQYQSDAEREALDSGKMTLADVILDLSTTKGRNAAIKTYMPVVMAVVQKYVGKSKLDRTSLLSAALEGASKALNEWDSSRGQSFKTYIGFAVRNAILSEINSHSQTLSGHTYYANKTGHGDAFSTVSLDAPIGKDTDGNTLEEIIAGLGKFDPTYKNSDTYWAKLFGIMDKKFNTRDMDVFYRYFGLNGRKKEKAKDIARSYGMSPGNINNSIINKIIKWLKSDLTARNTLSVIRDLYVESLYMNLSDLSKEEITEVLLSDDVYVMLESAAISSEDHNFINSLQWSLSQMPTPETQQEVVDCLENGTPMSYSSSVYLLSHMYPCDTFDSKSADEIVGLINEIKEKYKTYNNQK